MRHLLAWWIGVGMGCTGRPVVSAPVANDDTQALPDTGLINAVPDAPDPPEAGIQIVTPVYRVEPYSEANYCMFGSFEGDGPLAINYRRCTKMRSLVMHSVNGLRPG